MKEHADNRPGKLKKGSKLPESSRGDLLKESQKVPIFPNQYSKKKDDKETANPLLSNPELTNPIFALGS